MLRVFASRLAGSGVVLTRSLGHVVEAELAVTCSTSSRILPSLAEPRLSTQSPWQRSLHTSSTIFQETATKPDAHHDQHTTEARKGAGVDQEHSAAQSQDPEETHKRQEEGQANPGNRSGSYWLHQPVYDPGYVDGIAPKHKEPELWHEKTAYAAVTLMRWTFDKVTNYGPKMTEKKWMFRICFLETVAGVPGMVGAMFRHLHSLRQFRRDHGWIHTLLEEAENERMHLLTFMQLTQPGPVMRAMVLVTQGVFFNLYSLFYLMSPRHCHAFVGYLEEEAVKTYTHCLADIDQDRNGMGSWATKPGPDVALRYWALKPGATLRDVVLQVRADEACHSHVNHTFASMKKLDQNPFQGERAHIIP